jgi:hypothetical protein
MGASMKTQPRLRAAPSPDRPDSISTPSRYWTTWIGSFLVYGAVAVGIMGMYLAVYAGRHLEVPIGWDTSEYLWRTYLAQDIGVHRLADAIPQLATPLSGRPAFPVIVASLSSLLGASPFTIGFVLSSVMAAVIGLAAAAFVGSTKRSTVPELAAVAIAVALSPFVVRLMQPEAYMDSMFAAAVVLAASVAVVLALERWGAMVSAVVLLGAAAVVHWSFFEVYAAVLLLTAAFLLPRSWTAWRAGRTSVVGSASARVLGVVIGGAALGGAMIYGVLGSPAPRPRLDIAEFRKKLRGDLRKYFLPFTLPAAAVGAASMAVESRGDKQEARRASAALLLLLAWCGVVGAGYVAMVFLGFHIPAHRFLSFALALPILGILAVLWAARWVARWARPLGVALVVAAIAAGSFSAYNRWLHGNPWTDAGKIRDAELAAAYLDAAGAASSRPVVFLVNTTDWNGVSLMGDSMRLGLPPERMPHAVLFVGSPDDYLRGEPADTPLARRYFRAVERVSDQNPIALITPAFSHRDFGRWAREHPEKIFSSRVGVVGGPAPPPGSFVEARSLNGPPVGRINPVRLGILAVGTLLAIFAIGLGWAMALLGRWLMPRHVIAVAPALGIAALVVGGTFLDRVGVRLVGAPGAAAAVAVAAAGWLAFVLVRRWAPAE